MLTLEKLKQVFIPLNVYNKPNNLQEARNGVQLYNDSVNLYDALQLITPSGSTTDLTNTPSSTDVLVSSSSGADTTILAATTTSAGVMSAADKINLSSLITLSGVSAASLHLGSFSGSIIPDNSTIKDALQSLETTVGSIPLITTGHLTSASLPITVTNGTNSVVGSGTTITFNPALVELDDLGGSLLLSQLSTTGASSGQFITYDGSDWVPTSYTPPVQDHNTLTGKQGGAASQYYHLPLSVYNKLLTTTASTVLGRSASAGEVELLTTGKSIITTGGEIKLVNDSASPGNLKYYGTDGTGVKGFFSVSGLASVTEVQVTDSSNIDFTVTNPTTTPNITADLTSTGVTAGLYGSASQVPALTVDAKGRITAASNAPILINSTAVSDFNESVDDRVNTLLQAGSGVTLTYNDVANTLTIAATAGGLTGTTDRVPYWSSPSTLVTSDNLAFNGTYLRVGNPASSIARFTTKGLGASSSTFGYIHQNSTGTDVLKVADNGALTIGAFGEVYLHPDALNLSTGTDYPVSVSGGKLVLYSDVTVQVEGGGSTTNTPSLKSVATRSTNLGDVSNAQIEGTFSAPNGTNRYSDLLITTSVTQAGGTSPIRSIYINPSITSAVNYAGIEINAPSHTALKTTAGNVSFNFGSDSTGDIYYRNAQGNLERLPIGTSSQILGSTGTVPAWTTTAGALPGGSNGDILMYVGGNWTSASPLTESQTGLTGTTITLASTPLANTVFMLFRNGVFQTPTDDYTISGPTITTSVALISADKITAIYYI